MATKIELQIPVERQKAAQAAGNFELEDLPGRLATPDAAVRVGKAPKQDKAAAKKAKRKKAAGKKKRGY